MGRKAKLGGHWEEEGQSHRSHQSDGENGGYAGEKKLWVSGYHKEE